MQSKCRICALRSKTTVMFVLGHAFVHWALCRCGPCAVRVACPCSMKPIESLSKAEVQRASPSLLYEQCGIRKQNEDSTLELCSFKKVSTLAEETAAQAIKCAVFVFHSQTPTMSRIQVGVLVKHACIQTSSRLTWLCSSSSSELLVYCYLD